MILYHFIPQDNEGKGQLTYAGVLVQLGIIEHVVDDGDMLVFVCFEVCPRMV